MNGHQFIGQEQHTNPLVAEKDTPIRRRFGRKSRTGPGTWQEDEQPGDQNEPNAKDREQIQKAELQVLTGQNQVVIVDVFEQGKKQNKPNEQYQRYESRFSRGQNMTSMAANEPAAAR